MSRSIKELSIEVCDRVTVNTPETIFGTNDRIARILRTSVNDILRDIMRSAMRNGVSGFQSQWVFATKPGVYAYRMPPDLYKVIPYTEQLGRSPIGILGPVNPQTWNNWVSGASYSTIPMAWRIKNNLIHFESTPTKEEIVIIEYLSRFPAVRDATDDDLEIVDGRLTPIASLVPRDGYVAPDALNAVEREGSKWGSAEWGTALWGKTATAELGRIPVTSTKFPAFQVREEKFQSDDDICAIDNDHVVSLGMTWRLRKGLSMPYAEEMNEYETEKDLFLAQDGSIGRDFSFGNGNSGDEVTPLGNGIWSVS